MIAIKKIKNKILQFIIALLLFDVIIIAIIEQVFQNIFAAIPYYRLAILFITFIFFLPELVFSKIKINLKKTTNEGLFVFLWCVFSVIELIYGIVKGNPKIYIIADFVYILFGAYLFMILSSKMKFNSLIDANIESFTYWFLIIIYPLLIFSFTISEVFFILLLSTSYLFLIQKKYKLLIVSLIPFFIQITNSNRALLICFLTLVLLFGAYKLSLYLKKQDRLLLITFVLLFIVFFYEEILTILFGFIPKNTQLYYRLKQLLEIINSGVDFNNPYHISIAQRLVEAKLVLQLWLSDFWSFVFGCGLGGVIDGALFIDPSVTKTALLGSKSVHNIHLLPFALIHKYGMFGLIVFGMLLVEFYNSINHIIKKTMNSVFILWNLVFVLLFIYSLPAASFLWTTPLFWIALVMKKRNRYE
jgi:hypothetical protein